MYLKRTFLTDFELGAKHHLANTLKDCNRRAGASSWRLQRSVDLREGFREVQLPYACRHQSHRDLLPANLGIGGQLTCGEAAGSGDRIAASQPTA